MECSKYMQVKDGHCISCRSVVLDISPQMSDEGSHQSGEHILPKSGSELSEFSHISTLDRTHIIFRGKAFEVSKFKEEHP